MRGCSFKQDQNDPSSIKLRGDKNVHTDLQLNDTSVIVDPRAWHFSSDVSWGILDMFGKFQAWHF